MRAHSPDRQSTFRPRHLPHLPWRRRAPSRTVLLPSAPLSRALAAHLGLAAIVLGLLFAAAWLLSRAARP
jgi:hypothetical protein